jgi:hypothetical protein
VPQNNYYDLDLNYYLIYSAYNLAKPKTTHRTIPSEYAFSPTHTPQKNNGQKCDRVFGIKKDDLNSFLEKKKDL